MTEQRNDKDGSADTKVASSDASSLPVVASSEHTGDTQKAVCKQIIRSIWTHEPWLFFKVVVKSNEEMGDYIALHGLVPQNELPLKMRNKIPENEIWIRENVYADLDRRKRILAHEYAELDLMVTQGMPYKEAHNKAEFIEHLYYPTKSDDK